MKKAKMPPVTFLTAPSGYSFPRTIRSSHFSTCQHRWYSCANTTQRASSNTITVRCADRADIKEASRVLSRVFSEEEKFVRELKYSRFGSWLLSLYQTAACFEMAVQLKRRIKRAEQNNNKKRHLMLIAEDQTTGELLGCLEMGLVNVPRLLREGVFSEVKQWEEASREDDSRNRLDRNENIESSDDENIWKSALQSTKNGTNEKTMMNKEPYIGNLAVMTEHRRRGVGRALMKGAMEHAMKIWDAETVWLHVDGRSVKARGLYASLGFECKAREPGWYSAIGRVPRLLLRRGVRAPEVKRKQSEWREARVVRGKELSVGEYLAYCWYDLKRTKRMRDLEESE